MHAGAPSAAPSNLAVQLLATEENEVLMIILLTWSQENSSCVVVYHVEVTATNSVTNMDTTSQHITLTLQIGVEYSFRVRGADSSNRLGKWSDSYHFSSKPCMHVKIIMHACELCNCTNSCTDKREK